MANPKNRIAIRAQYSMQPDLFEALRKEARLRGASVSGLIQVAVRRELERSKTERRLVEEAMRTEAMKAFAA